MIKITYLQTAEEVIQAFNNARRVGDDAIPYVGVDARLIVSTDGQLVLEDAGDDIQIADGVTYEKLCDAMAETLGIEIVKSPSTANG